MPQRPGQLLEAKVDILIRAVAWLSSAVFGTCPLRSNNLFDGALVADVLSGVDQRMMLVEVDAAFEEMEAHRHTPATHLPADNQARSQQT